MFETALRCQLLVTGKDMFKNIWIHLVLLYFYSKLFLKNSKKKKTLVVLCSAAHAICYRPPYSPDKSCELSASGPISTHANLAFLGLMPMGEFGEKAVYIKLTLQPSGPDFLDGTVLKFGRRHISSCS